VESRYVGKERERKGKVGRKINDLCILKNYKNCLLNKFKESN